MFASVFPLSVVSLETLRSDTVSKPSVGDVEIR